MKTAVLSFPGHFLQTILCLRSLHRWYGPCEHYDIILDDVDVDVWPQYLADADRVYQQHLRKLGIKCRIIPVSQITDIKQCGSGWWRQQLIKLTMDLVLGPGEFFVVDGDVIFDNHCQVRGVVPVAVRQGSEPGTVDRLNANYVSWLLGTPLEFLQHHGQLAVSNPVPFRWLHSDVLQNLRQHVEQRFQGDFVQLHLQWFQDQSIVAFLDDSTARAMSEWELIELYRLRILRHDDPTQDIGRGYPLLQHTSHICSEHGVFRHGYVRDWQIGRVWFEQQNLVIDQDLWHRITEWTRYYEPHREPVI